ncbi:hypothetical protein [Zunongwangia sp. HGR-M22]|uniref:hypothetical protein n=1 Tax=Zunongwangia sp. HGR-M22 TaxID=3015168 RepID=UPI0022DD2429|nr:hypothetical protein [Zunongwangia sp. HGR-M22]WBL26176.1 hypothetical protein PBT91_02555 [Zunongwangia sp. HGR-M22]
MKIKLLALSLFTYAAALSQSDIATGNISDGYKITRGGTNGTPFLFDEWHVGYGIYANETRSDAQLINYDIHQNNIVYKTTSGSNNIMVLKDSGFKGMIIQNSNAKVLLNKIPGYDFEKNKKETKYYEIVSPPSKIVIIEYIKDLDDPNASGWTSSSNNTYNAEYKFKTKYYVINNNNKYEEVKLKNRSVIKIFKDKKAKISRYLEEKNIEIEEPIDLIPVAEYYHSLLK